MKSVKIQDFKCLYYTRKEKKSGLEKEFCPTRPFRENTVKISLLVYAAEFSAGWQQRPQAKPGQARLGPVL
jgi:hypothetical protein